MRFHLFPAYHHVGAQLIADVPTTIPTSVSVCLTPALFTEENLPDYFSYSCVLQSDKSIPIDSAESYIAAAAEVILELVEFSAFPSFSPSEKATIIFYSKDIEHKKEGGDLLPFSIMLKPTKEVFLNAVTLIDMQAAAISAARTAGFLTAVSFADSLLPGSPSTTH